ncbi:MAG: hypothetical protein LBC59_02930, partial [Chitinispirillales bacterium]|nr:hypothetical protein [Chitinispirillales bacterium]
MTLFNKMKAVGVLGVLIGLFAAGGAFADVPTLSAGTVNRTSDIAAEIGFTVGAAGGTAYYQVVASGA